MRDDPRIAQDGKTGTRPSPYLTERERQVMSLVCEEGLSHAEVAQRLGIGKATVKVYASRALHVLSTDGIPTTTLRLVVRYWKRRLEEVTGQVEAGTS